MSRTKLVVFLMLTFLPGGCGRQPIPEDNALSGLFPTSGLREEPSVDEAWLAALAPREFSFPADHGAHEDYRVEWWYYTGNMEEENGRRFGYQLTFFRTGLHKQPRNPSRWALRDLYTAHFAISDIGNKRHDCFQRNSRQGIGQAGAEVGHYEVWNGDWRVWQADENHRLKASESDVSIDLTLIPTKPPVLHGDQGLSQKGPTPGNASYYYSFTRMSTVGTVRIGDQTFAIRGDSWMDHEFSTSFLEPGQLGWDWFSLQLDNGVDLMFYRMRRDDGTTDEFSSGSFVNRTGEFTHLPVTDYDLNPGRRWKSSKTGGNYPLEWEIAIPSLGYKLVIRPAFDEQEMTTDDTTGISYWEGAIDVQGESSDGRVTGDGYMELTGYVGEGLGSLFD